MYGWKPRHGVLILATHKGRIKERLIAAFHDSLHGVSAEALPPELRRTWIDVYTKATAVEGTKESGRFAPSINALTEDEAVDLGMSRALLKLSGSLVHDYATISDDSPSPNRASRARRAATSAGIS